MATAVDSVVSPQPISFNLKTLLLVITGVGILLTPAKWFGAPYLVSVAFSATLVICCIVAVKSESRSAAFLLSFFAAAIGLPFAIVFLVFFVHAFFNFIACAALLLIGVRSRIYATVTAGVAIAVYGWFVWDGVEMLQELAALKSKFPFVSVDERLAFERQSIQPVALNAVPPRLAPTVAGELDRLEDSLQWPQDRRVWALESLHEDTYYQFARVSGFGFSRMPMLNPRHLVLEPRQTVSVPVRLAIDSSAPGWKDLSPIHSTAILDFVDPDRSGLVRSRKQVAGFESHGFSELPQLLHEDDRNAERWQIRRLELVSLLRHDTPRVYTAETFPQMDQLADVPHRALNEFEAAALPQLETAEDIVVDQQPERIQMLGAVRAATTCLECHEGQRGKLLGAFSYEIAPIVNTTQAAK